MKGKSILLLIVAGCLSIQSCGNADKVREKLDGTASMIRKEQRSEPVTVRVIDVVMEEGAVKRSYVGRVEPSKSAVISAQFPGTVSRLAVSKGRRVGRGDVIAVLESESLVSAYDIAKATLEQARDGYDRMMQAYTSGSVTEAKRIEVKTQLEKAQAAERAARKQLSDCTVTAPYAGIVDEVFIEQGTEASMGAPLVRLLDISGIEIHFSVPEGEYPSLYTGQQATVEIPALGRTASAALAVKGVSASPLSHTYDCTLKSVSDASGLMPGMVCKVDFTDAQEGSIVIPASAVQTDNGGRHAWVVSLDGTVEKRYLEIAGYASDGIAVSEGLTNGERVIVEGARKVSSGMKVKTVY